MNFLSSLFSANIAVSSQSLTRNQQSSHPASHVTFIYPYYVLNKKIVRSQEESSNNLVLVKDKKIVKSPEESSSTLEVAKNRVRDHQIQPHCFYREAGYRAYLPGPFNCVLILEQVDRKKLCLSVRECQSLENLAVLIQSGWA